jgi:hypothetical protein
MSMKIQQLIGANGYTPFVYSLPNQQNNAGGGAGQSVTVSFATTFQDNYGNPVLPAQGLYSVQVTPNQSATAAVTNKTASGFSVVLTPLPSTGTLASGQFDILVHS